MRQKFVSMQDINRVFLNIDEVDYVTVNSVTDTSVDLKVYLKTKSIPKDGTTLHSQLNDCGVVLGKMIARSVSFSLIPTSLFGKFTDHLSNLLVRAR